MMQKLIKVKTGILFQGWIEKSTENKPYSDMQGNHLFDMHFALDFTWGF
jgi:hypothetical protein